MKISHTILIAALLGGTTSPALLAAQGGSSGATERWQIDDAGGRWLGTDVAVGDHGSVVIAAHELNTPGLSVRSTAGATPILDFPLPDTWQVRVDAARAGQTLAAMVVQEDPQASSFVIWPELKVWRSAHGGQPDFVYRFPITSRYMSNGMDVLISDDGERIVAYFTDLETSSIEVRVFARDGRLLLDHRIERELGAVLGDSGAISQDGRLLLIDVSNRPALIDLDTGDELWTWDHHSMFGGLALSGDGSTVAIGGEQWAEVWSRTAAGDFTLTRRWDFASERIAGAMALDFDGSHLAQTVMDYNEWFQVRVKDLHKDVELYRHEFAAPGNGVNLWPSEICIGEDAVVVAGASWGDSFDLTPTGFAFDADGVLTAELRTPGSAMAMDMNPSGQVMALSTKAAHVNQFGSGGEVICADTRTAGLQVAGFPQAGGKLALSLQGAGTHAQLAIASALGATPTPFGVSQLDWQSMLRLSPPVPLSASGITRQITLPDAPAFVGQALHLQAAFFEATAAGRRGELSNRVSLRVLP